MSLIPINLLDDKNIKDLRNKFQATDAFYTSKLLCKEYGKKINNLNKNKFFKSYINSYNQKFNDIIEDIDDRIHILKNELEDTRMIANTIKKENGLKKKISGLETSKQNYQFNSSLNIKNSEFYNLYFQINNEKVIPFFVALNKKISTTSYFIVNSNLNDEFCGHLNIFGTNKKNLKSNFNKNFAYIEWVHPNKICGISLNGTKVLNILLNLCRLHNIHRVDLQDESKIINCKKTSEEYSSIDLRLYKFFKDGLSWYEKFGFMPCKESLLRKDMNFHKPNKTNFKLSFESAEYKKFYEKYKNAIKYIRNFDTKTLLHVLNSVYNNPKVHVSDELKKKDIIKLGIFINILEKYQKKDIFKLDDVLINLYKKDCAYYHIFVKFVLGKGTLFKNNTSSDIITLVISSYLINSSKSGNSGNSGKSGNSGNNGNSGNSGKSADEYGDKILDLLSAFEIISNVYY